MALIFAVFSLASSAVNADSLALHEVTGHLPDLAFSLIDDHGRVTSEQDVRGQVVLLYFGFTGCTAQCPTAMARLARSAQKLATPKLRILFVSIDPLNDTPDMLHTYIVSLNSASIAGLTGSIASVQALTKRYRTAWRPALTGEEIIHGDLIYVFDAKGRARFIATPDDSDEAIMQAVKELLYDKH